MAEVFYGSPGMGMNGKKLFIRPEDLEIGGGAIDGTTALKGTVNKVNFLGSANELEVLLAGNKITVRTGNRNIKQGDTVTISLPSGVHYITE